MTSPNMSRNAGVTLIELLVALGLGAFIMLGVVSVFISSKSSATAEAALARVQENGRLAIQLISQDIRKAHYSGCNSVGGLVDIIATGVTWDGVRGFERDASAGTWSPSPDDAPMATGKAGARNGSDMLNIQMAVSLGTNILAADLTSDDDTVTLTRNPNCEVQQDDLIILSSCLSAHLFRITNAIACENPDDEVAVEFKNTGNLELPIEPGYRYGDPSELMRYESVAWFVADTGRDMSGQDVYALYRSSNGVTEEMVEGVEYIKFEYGQRIANQMRYVSASDASIEWDDVSTIRVALLLQGYDSVRNDDDVEPYNLLSSVISATGDGSHGGGRVLRKVFSITSTMRNTPYDL